MTRFLAKIAAQKTIPLLPGGEGAYHWLQRHVTRSIVPTSALVRQKIGVGLAYVDALERVAVADVLRRGLHVDLGAGWHFTIPLLFWRLGSERQTLIDVQRHARRDVVFEVARLVAAETVAGARTLPLPTAEEALEDYLGRLGMRYVVPLNGPSTLADGSATLVTSTQVLLHPPRAEVRRIFERVARALRPGGVFAGTIHLYDLYSNLDPGLPRFNFLRYSSRAWERWFNGPLMAYNRLRASDYERLFAGLPFRAEVWDVAGPTAEDLAQLDLSQPSEEFSAYAREDLASSGLLFVMRRT